MPTYLETRAQQLLQAIDGLRGEASDDPPILDEIVEVFDGLIEAMRNHAICAVCEHCRAGRPVKRGRAQHDRGWAYHGPLADFGGMKVSCEGEPIRQIEWPGVTSGLSTGPVRPARAESS